jgi:hypothetical protein
VKRLEGVVVTVEAGVAVDVAVGLAVGDSFGGGRSDTVRELYE